MDKKQFALEQISPYYKDPTTCGYEYSSCKYLTSDGRQCVLGKNLKHVDVNMEGDATYILEGYNEGMVYDEDAEPIDLRSKMLKEEVADILTVDEWKQLQNVHDYIAIGFHSKTEDDRQIALTNLKGSIQKLRLFTLEELKEYCNK
jgi:hypothetical protein